MANRYPLKIGPSLRVVAPTPAQQVRRQQAGRDWSPGPSPWKPFNRLIGRIRGMLVGITVYPPTGSGPPGSVTAQQLDCPFLGRCGGCWVESWDAGDVAPPAASTAAANPSGDGITESIDTYA